MLIALILTARFYSKLFNPRRNEHPNPPQKNTVRFVMWLLVSVCAGLPYTNVMVRGRCLCMGGTARMGTQCDAVKTAVREG